MILTSLPSNAEVLCYPSGSAKRAHGATVQIFKEGCPSNFTAVPGELLGLQSVFLMGSDGPPGEKGATGLQGAPGPKGQSGQQGEAGLPGPIGPKGIVGVAGESGPRGDTGQQGTPGPKGPVGPAGLPGPKGIAGSKGTTGVRGIPGISASDLFFFTGGTGSTLLGSQGNQQIYPFNQSGGPTTAFIDPTDLLVPIGSSCSALTFALTLDTAPGAGNSWSFLLLHGTYSSTTVTTPLCSLAGAAKGCSYTAVLPAPLSEDSSIALVASKVGTAPPATKARWSIRCTAP